MNFPTADSILREMLVPDIRGLSALNWRPLLDPERGASSLLIHSGNGVSVAADFPPIFALFPGPRPGSVTIQPPNFFSLGLVPLFALNGPACFSTSELFPVVETPMEGALHVRLGGSPSFVPFFVP